jgi:hypothetical protein
VELFSADLTGVPDLGSAGKAKVYVTPEARKVAERTSENADEMLGRCFWRFLHLKYKSGELRGDCEFTIGAREASQLIEELKEMDSKS